MGVTIVSYLLDQSREITQRAVAEGRPLTTDERRKVESNLKQVEECRREDAWVEGRHADLPRDWVASRKARDAQAKEDAEALQAAVDRFTAPAATKGLAAAVLDAGWSLKGAPQVFVPGWRVFGAKAATLPDADTWNTSTPGIVGIGRDERWLHEVMVRQDAGTLTAVEDFKQSARSVTGTVERELTSTGEKAELVLVMEHVVVEMKQQAVVLSDIPNAVLESVEGVRTFFDQELRYQVDQALDAHVLAQIAAASPPAGGGAGSLIERIRYGISAMREVGARPSVVAVNPDDGAALDLHTSPSGDDFVFPSRATGTASPVFGLRVVETPTITGNPLLLDPQMLGRLFVGTVRVDADPYSGFTTNTTTLRCEVRSLMHVRNIDGALELDGSS
jgi:hypothetical protein